MRATDQNQEPSPPAVFRRIDLATAIAWAEEFFGLSGSVKLLDGEYDSNFAIEDCDGRRYLLKIHAAHVSEAEAEAQASALAYLARRAPDLPLPPLFLAKSGAILAKARDETGRQRSIRLTGWLAGHSWFDPDAKGKQRPARSFISLGRILARLDRALADFRHPGAERSYHWDLRLAEQHCANVPLIEDSEKRACVAGILERFCTVTKPALAHLPLQVIHNDANDLNVLLDDAGAVCGLIDFGDMVTSWRVNELAVAATYALIGTTDPIGAILPLVAAYHETFPLGEAELDAVFDLVLTRLAVSIALAAKQIREQPDNAYLLFSQEDVWETLRHLASQSRDLCVMRLRACCFLPAHPNVPTLRCWFDFNNHRFGPVLNRELAADKVVILDGAKDGFRAGEESDAWWRRRILETQPRIAIGRHGEDRDSYKTHGQLAADGARGGIHLGIDLFLPAGESVLAPFPGEIADLGNDQTRRGFGGVVLLRHRTETGIPFWSLYGHLAPLSFAHLKPGQRVEQGAEIGRLGAEQENGFWPPHLHFQLLFHHAGWKAADIPGVAPSGQWPVWRDICPDPNIVLGIKAACSMPIAQAPEALVAERRHFLAPALSLAYDTPLKIVRGEGSRLYDEGGRGYLDLVNNVAHVGHCHPRIVAAADAQARLLNTNSRYLNDNLIEYARRLAAILPPELSTIFLVNSGSEANDLALRLAHAYTGQSDVLVLDHAYHGHLSSLIDISPYKFFGPGGEGRKSHVWVAEMPDLYRGRLRHDAIDAGRRYAESVATLLKDMGSLKRRPMAFIAEAIQGTGGQLPLPEGYLAAAYRYVRAGGGLCIADEVQVGFGRVGSHWWTFETQDVVPDIVTMGKPIGAGHPLAAVATRPDIARAFAPGMEYFNTFGGNPVSAAIGLAVLEIIRDERLIHNASVMGQRLGDGLRALAGRHQVIGDVRGLGLFLGVEFVKDRESRQPDAATLKSVIEGLKEDFVLTSSEGPYHNVLKLKPPLVIDPGDVDEFLEKLDSCLTRLGR